MLNFRRSLLVASLLSVAFVVTQPAESIAQTASFQGLGDLPGGGISSQARSISADGSVVTGGSTSAACFQTFRWTSEDGMVGLGELPEGSLFC